MKLYNKNLIMKIIVMTLKYDKIIETWMINFYIN